MFHLLLPLLLAGSARADEALHARVVELLSGMETTPTAAEWIALGPDAETELLTIAQDTLVVPTERGNALAALAIFPSERAHTLLVATLADPAANILFRRKSCSGLAHGWGGAAVPELTVALADSDVQLRQSAARALSKVEDPTAADALRARLAVETNGSVKKIIEKAVKP